jgi:hypothetical protein
MIMLTSVNQLLSSPTQAKRCAGRLLGSLAVEKFLLTPVL